MEEKYAGIVLVITGTLLIAVTGLMFGNYVNSVSGESVIDISQENNKVVVTIDSVHRYESITPATTQKSKLLLEEGDNAVFEVGEDVESGETITVTGIDRKTGVEEVLVRYTVE